MALLDHLFDSKQQSGPDSLADLCCKTICDNLDIISIKDQHGNRTLRDDITLPSEICDKIIEFVQRSTVSNADNSFFAMFRNTKATRLKRVSIASNFITDWAVMVIATPEVSHLDFGECRNLTTLSIECINAMCHPDLHSLAFRGPQTVLRQQTQNSRVLEDYANRGYIFNTPHLRRLAVHNINIPSLDYRILLGTLTNLTHLDISGATDVKSFTFLEEVPQLLSLCLYNVKNISSCKTFVAEICQLKKLRHLDISQSNHKYGYFKSPNQFLSTLMRGLPELVSLDIGGTNLAGTGVTEHPLEGSLNELELCDIQGLSSRVRKPLQFLGLYGTHHSACKRHDIPAEVIAGDATEEQILVALRICMDNKQELLQKILNDLYHVFRYDYCKRMDQALYMVLEAMDKYLPERHIQISGSATLFYIVKMKEKCGLPVPLRRKIIGTLLAGMNAHKDEETMMRNGCLALCQFHIPQDVMWNYEPLVKVLLHSARYAESEGFVQRIGIYLLNSLACQVEGEKKRLLGKLGCVRTMLNLVKYRVKYAMFDDVLEVAWSTMWNMTDETPINCQRFLDDMGMSLFLRCVKHFPLKEELLRNMMGLIGNVAEVDSLRSQLMQDRYVSVFAKLLAYGSGFIEVSYNAAGILAHLASDGVEAWTVESPTRDEVLEGMVTAIESWDLSASRNINYRSFLPLLRLLDVYHTPQCQHWAVWALANLTKVYPLKYCSLVEAEGGIEKLNNLLTDSRPYNRIKNLAVLVIMNCSLGDYSKMERTVLEQKKVIYENA
ncbi:protein zer-1 homolog [Venturia canescens]|uniref:protein zer-1 homolog n=1 Tax=Venturia canescens TaxID=32260 RepID=UPI001C9BF237|nr:protein zer-1 homolog [Venturia canescens]